MSTSRYDFTVHSFDTDAFGLLTAPRILGYCLESAIRSAEQLGFGIDELQSRGLTWVIARIKIELHPELRFGDVVTVETWPSGLMRSAATREFRLLRGEELVGLATSVWFVLDMESRLPVSPTEAFPSNSSLISATPRVMSLSRAIGSLAEPPEVEQRHSVRLADIDRNLHVTAASYLSWAMEGIPEPLWREYRFTSIDVQYLEECHLGQEVVIASRPSESGQRRHRITRAENGREVARLETTWVPRARLER
ncbi:MAG: thioesterase [Polyangiaceae bacterium]